ncbi:hypothetical protein, partial [Pseudomonas lundensis]|uniref:hypothetical protein n=1 Tax=Pseudomonas lundensis TaxID=86185 RepID=UPI001BAFF9E5
SSRKISLIRSGENSTSDAYFFQGGLPLQRQLIKFWSQKPFIKMAAQNAPFPQKIDTFCVVQGVSTRWPLTSLWMTRK